MKKIQTLIIMSALFGLSCAFTPQVSLAQTLACMLDRNSIGCYQSLGYTCIMTDWGINEIGYTCSKTITTTTTTSVLSYYTYGANVVNANTLYGYKTPHYDNVTTTETTTDKVVVYIDAPPTPIIYFENMPEGEVTVTLDSDRNRYYPEPAFTQEHGWVLNDEGETFNEEEDELFYRLEVPRVTLSRDGMNFDSKEAVIDYLKNSDFLDNLGLTEREQENSLSYVLSDLNKADETNYYYLTVLDEEAIEEISTLTITPTPAGVTRTYFALYPTQVPVRATGVFDFPEQERVEIDGFTVKETGEFLISDNMFVSFK